MTPDGRYVAFSCTATNLCPLSRKEIKFPKERVFVHDRQTGETTLVSVASDGTRANDLSRYPDISDDGRLVVFESWATNLVPDSGSAMDDIFLHDRLTGETIQISRAPDGSQSNGGSGTPSISADGRYIAFPSYASNLVPNDTNGVADVFVHDRLGSQATGTIAGTVTDSSDTSPVEGATVTTDTGQSDTMAGDGTYTINGVPVGDRTVTASAGGYAQQQKPAAVADGATTPLDFALGPAQEPTEVFVTEISHAAAGPKGKDLDITVVLLDDLGQPVVGASVSIDVEFQGSSYDSRTGPTGEDGTVTFKLRNAPLGTYTVTVTDVTAAGLTWEQEPPSITFTRE